MHNYGVMVMWVWSIKFKVHILMLPFEFIAITTPIMKSTEVQTLPMLAAGAQLLPCGINVC